MKIYLPNSAFLGNIDPFLKGIDITGSNTLKITANKNWISVHPVVLSMIAALGASLNPTKIECEKLEAKSRHYFERMGLFKSLNLKTGIKIVEHESAGRFIPLIQIKNSQELTKFITEMIPLLHLPPEQSDPIKYVVSELVRNVLEHSGSPNGAFICAQYYKKSNTIRIGVADTGVGIKETINNSYSAKTHLEAIRLALTPGITGTTHRPGGTESNAGAGLFFIKAIAQVNQGFFIIYSGNAMYKLLKTKPTSVSHRITLHGDAFLDRHSTGENYPIWNGTVVGIDFPLNKTAEFSTLLDLIKTTYLKTIKERQKERYRKPRFV